MECWKKNKKPRQRYIIDFSHYSRNPLSGIPFILIILFCLNSIISGDPVYREKEGWIVFEAESAPLCSQWQKETEFTGYTGDCYYTWRGGNLFNAPGQGVLSYRIIVTKPGKYHLMVRNRHEHHDATLENDIFTRMDKDKWTKMFSSQNKKWTWHSRHEHSHGDKPEATYQLTAGEHIFQISARSANFSIDRIHLVHESVGRKKGENTSIKPTVAIPVGEKPYEKLANLAGQVIQMKNIGMVMKTVRKKAGGTNGTAEEARRLMSAIESFAKESMVSIRVKAGSDPVGAIHDAETLAALLKGDVLAAEPKKFAKELSSKPEVRNELAADKTWQNIEELKTKLKPHKGEHDLSDPDYMKKNRIVISGLIRGAQMILKRFPGTRAAEKAEELVKKYSK